MSDFLGRLALRTLGRALPLMQPPADEAIFDEEGGPGPVAEPLPVARPAAQHREPERERAPVRGAVPTEAASAVPAIQADTAPVAQPPAPVPPAPVPVVPVPSTPAPVPNPAPVETRTPPPAPAPSRQAERRPLVLQARLHRAPAPAPEHSRRSAPAEPAETVVRVTIGRIEVRAVTEQPQPAAPSRRPSPPAMTLDDYLRDRSGGGRP